MKRLFMSRPAMCHFEFQMSWRHQEGWMCPHMSQVSCYNTSCSWRPSKHLCNGVWGVFWLGVNCRLLKLIQAAAPDTNVAGRWGNEKCEILLFALIEQSLGMGGFHINKHDDICDMLPSLHCIIFFLCGIIWRILVHFDLWGPPCRLNDTAAMSVWQDQKSHREGRAFRSFKSFTVLLGTKDGKNVNDLERQCIFVG